MHPDESADRAALERLTILYAEDEAAAREQTAQYLGRRAGRVVAAEDGQVALARFDAESPDIVVSDILMPGLDGLGLAAAVRERAPHVPVILVTAFEKAEYLRRAIEASVDRYVLKPVDPDQLDAALLHAARRVRAERELADARRREVVLLHARHAAAIGTLAGGLAHDYNNLLQAIIGAVDMAAQSCTCGGAARYEEIARRGFVDATRLAARLRLLYEDAREYVVEPVDALLRASVDDALQETRCTARVDLPAGTPVRHHPDKLREVFQGLARNAADAMATGGVLDVTGAVEHLPPDNPQHLPAGGYLALVFHDTGTGIRQDLLPTLFEPYVSSKPRGLARGTGLGLAVAKAIVSMHRGTITAESVPGDTRITVRLPLG